MAKLNQLVACMSKIKTNAKEKITEVHHKLKQSKLLSGINRSYQPKIDGDNVYPPESQLVQYCVPKAISEFTEASKELLDSVYSQDATNCVATADLVVDGKTLAKSLPVTYLLFLEKQANDYLTFASQLPTLDLAQEWHKDEASDFYRSNPTKTLKTKKVWKNHVKSPATDKHPAQVETYTEDEVEGTWTKVDFSGAIPAKDRNEIEARARKLLAAVKVAREEANLAEIKTDKIGEKVLGYLFQG